MALVTQKFLSPRLFAPMCLTALSMTLPAVLLAQATPVAQLRVESQPASIATHFHAAQASEATLSPESASSTLAARLHLATPAPEPQIAFPSTNVGTTSGSYITFTTNFSASTTVTGDGVYTLGASGSDFQNVGTGTCDTNGFPYTYAAGSTCTTTVSFTANKPGNRIGAEILYTSTAGNYYYGYVNGIGNGPQVTFATATPAVSTIASGLSAYNSALDGAGDLWVTDSAASSVKEFVPTAGVFPTSPTNTYTGFTTPQGIVVDGLGNVFVGDSGKGYIWKLSATNGVVPAGTAPVVYVSFTSAGTQPFFVALDPTDAYLYFIAIYSGSKYLIDCAITTGSCALLTTFTAPAGLAVDSAGYKYISDSGTVIQLGTAYNSTTKTTLLSGLATPTGLSTDAAGDLYVASSSGNTITEYIATGGLVSSSSATRTLATGLNAPAGVTVDSLGNVFISDSSNTAVKEIAVTTPPTLTYANTTMGNTSATQTFALQNIGNAALTFPALASSTNPSVSSNFTISGSSTCPQVAAGGTAGTLAYGSTCNYVAAYHPTSTGATTSFFAITDNSLNVTTTQDAKVTGSTGGLTVQAIGATAAKGSTAVGLEAIVGWGGGATPTGALSIKVNGSTTGVGTITCTAKAGHNNCTATYNASSLAPGNYTITANQPADANYSATSASGTLSITGSSAQPASLKAASLAR